MKKLAFLFPGQGSQHPGMGRELADNVPKADEMFDHANRILEYDLKSKFINSDEDGEDLKKTENTQPALFVTSAATFDYLKTQGINPTHVAGHSLGEYSALYAAGVFDFETGCRLVRARGVAFADAGTRRAGAMAAIIGLTGEQVLAICQQVASKDPSWVVMPANYNEPTQTVISGNPDAIRVACEVAKEAGAKRALLLPVSGAFHSPLVESASEVMYNEFSAVKFNAPHYKFINNVHAKFTDNPVEIRKGLIEQVTGTVHWTETIRKLIADGVEGFVEIGAGKVLSGLVRRIDTDKATTIHTTENWTSIQKTIESLKSE